MHGITHRLAHLALDVFVLDGKVPGQLMVGQINESQLGKLPRRAYWRGKLLRAHPHKQPPAPAFITEREEAIRFPFLGL